VLAWYFSLRRKKAAGLAAAFGLVDGGLLGVVADLVVQAPAEQFVFGHAAAEFSQGQAQFFGNVELGLEVGVLFEGSLKRFWCRSPPNRRSGSPASGPGGLCP
jgi:hypothetical protein